MDKSLEEKRYGQGYKEGHADGSADKPSMRTGRALDFLNTSDVQAYDDGYDKGHKDGKANRDKK